MAQRPSSTGQYGYKEIAWRQNSHQYVKPCLFPISKGVIKALWVVRGMVLVLASSYSKGVAAPAAVETEQLLRSRQPPGTSNELPVAQRLRGRPPGVTAPCCPPEMTFIPKRATKVMLALGMWCEIEMVDS
ncbi:hypothetical protein EYF80_029773 [Liparis tanakae]|uniref:Uncharacterized protein n=1 Tax=Liparis tanakae TaxID=230148 RepID=A0A4Z2H3Z4_9TELE|nr:hypothetical protein EYF80_029773 [Liparis tanakae]